MVYDPIRDCDIPSPAATEYARSHSYFSPSVVTPTGQGSAGRMSFPPGFADMASPSAGSRTSLGHLLGETQEDVLDRRRSSGRTSSFSSTGQEERRPSLSMLLNDGHTSASSPRAISGYQSPAQQSPSHPSRPLGDFAVPAPPSTLSTQHSVDSHSPKPIHTPRQSPVFHSYTPLPESNGRPVSRGGSMTSSARSGSMMPPQHTDLSSPSLHHTRLPSREDLRTAPSPSLSQLALRSPSVSVSPRTASAGLPQSRPTSSKGPRQMSQSRSPRYDDAMLSAGSSRSAPSPVQRRAYRADYHRQPITPTEIARLEEAARRNNPLRSRAPPPSSYSSQPPEDAQSYFSAPSRPSSSRYSPSGPSSPRSPKQETLRRKREPEEEQSEQRRKVSQGGDFVAERAKLVAEHYNSRPEVGVQNRQFSPIYGLKNFNNWIKSVMIGKFLCRDPTARRGTPSGRVLDIGCGKGGDLNKWSKHRIGEYVGLDIADVSIEQAQGRWNSMRGYRFPAHFFAHDCYGQPLSERVPPDLTRLPFDNVTMQFCMHYAFETSSKARMMLENVSRYLRAGGVFFGTIPNPDSLMDRLASVPDDAEQLTFGNSKYHVTFDARAHKGLYGHAYHFFLDDAVDVPEYVVQWDNFVALASEYRLRLVYRKPFNEIYDEEQANPEFSTLLTRMNVIDSQGASAMDAEQWEAATIYMGFAFEKY